MVKRMKKKLQGKKPERRWVRARWSVTWWRCGGNWIEKSKRIIIIIIMVGQTNIENFIHGVEINLNKIIVIFLINYIYFMSSYIYIYIYIYTQIYKLYIYRSNLEMIHRYWNIHFQLPNQSSHPNGIHNIDLGQYLFL